MINGKSEVEQPNKLELRCNLLRQQRDYWMSRANDLDVELAVLRQKLDEIEAKTEAPRAAEEIEAR